MITHHQYRSETRGGPCTFKYHVTPCGRPRDDHDQVDYKTKAEDQSMRKRVALVVYVDLVESGTHHTPESTLENIQIILNNTVSHYNPEVTLAPNSFQPINTDKPESGVFYDGHRLGTDVDFVDFVSPHPNNEGSTEA